MTGIKYMLININILFTFRVHLGIKLFINIFNLLYLWRKREIQWRNIQERWHVLHAV